ncbi:MAG: hypothetical protein WC972_02945 [Trueperaceae bacterium]
MTTPQEPLTLTLEEAMQQVAASEHGSSLTYTDDPGRYPRKAWAVMDAMGDAEAWARRWEDAASEALGRPVVARDDAAELRAALEALVESHVANKEPHDNLWKLLVRSEVMDRARAALAATEGQP